MLKLKQLQLILLIITLTAEKCPVKESEEGFKLNQVPQH